VKRALVSGASGFIGRALCARLQRDGVAVRALMRQRAPGPWDDTWLLDLGREPVPKALFEGVDTVFHLAGKAHVVSERAVEDEDHRRITVDGTRSLLTAADNSDLARVVFFSTVKAMGEHSEGCQDERAVCRPETPYGRAKLEAEGLVSAFGAAQGAHAVNLRLPLVYGADNRGNLARMLESIAAGRFPPLPETGNKRSMVHVDDVVESAIRASAIPRAAGQTYIITDGRSYSTREIYDLMCALLHKRPARWSIPVLVLRLLAGTGDLIGVLRGKRFVFDSDTWRKLSESAWYCSAKAEQELDFRPTRNLRDALPEIAASLGLAD
jgi:nucleoside-diphosphate-sugar epimerase